MKKTRYFFLSTEDRSECDSRGRETRDNAPVQDSGRQEGSEAGSQNSQVSGLGDWAGKQEEAELYVQVGAGKENATECVESPPFTLPGTAYALFTTLRFGA